MEDFFWAMGGDASGWLRLRTSEVRAVANAYATIEKAMPAAGCAYAQYNQVVITGNSEVNLMEGCYKVSGASFCYPVLETTDIEIIFLELAEQWRHETGIMSLVTKMSMHSAYQRIIGMGQPVVPLILRELEQEPDHWFWALQAITGANPVKPEQRGRLQKMAEAWIEWGQENGYRW